MQGWIKKWWLVCVLIGAAILILGWGVRCERQVAQCRANYAAQESRAYGFSVNGNAAEQEVINAACEPSGYFCRLFSSANFPTWLLVFVGIGAIWAALITLRAIERQADQMERQTGILMEYNKATRENADAAIENARATRASVDLIINKERARVFVEVEPLQLRPKGDLRALTHSVCFKVIFHGTTFAFIEDSSANAIFSESSQPPNPGDRFLLGKINIPPAVPPGTEPMNLQTPFYHIFDQFEIDQINHKKAFIHFTGFIKYKDFMGSSRETSFCYSWQVRPPFPAVGFEGWEKSGPPEANRET